MKIVSGFSNSVNYFYSSSKSENKQPSFGCKVINVSPKRFNEIIKEFEKSFHISDNNPIPEFLEMVNMSKVLKPMTGVFPDLNPKPKTLIEWKPEMSADNSTKWCSKSIFKQVFYHGTTDKSFEKIRNSGFDTSLSGELQCGGGIYVTPNFSEAKSYSEGRVASLKINIANPMIIDNSNIIEFDKMRNKVHQVVSEHSEKKAQTRDEKEVLFNEVMRRIFLRHGFDMVKNKTYDHFIILDPKDIVLIKQ